MNKDHCIAQIKSTVHSIYQPEDQSLDILLEHIYIKEVKKSEDFQKVHDPAIEIGVLVQGALMVKRHEDDGSEKVVFFNTPDKTPFVGVLDSLIKDEASNTQIKALEDSWLGVINYKDLLKLYGEHHELETLGRKILEKHYLIALEQARFRQNTEGKEKLVIAERDFPEIAKLCEKKDWANYIGVKPSTLSRLLEKFRKITQN